MKKFLLSLTIALITVPAFARDFYYEYEGNRIIYQVLDNKAMTCQVGSEQQYTAGTNIKGALIIPSVAVDKNQNKEYTVVKIDCDAFDSCDEITSAIIPNTVTEMGTGVFADCPNLVSVTIGNSVTAIDAYSFMDCTSLTTVYIGNSVTSISGFEGCTALKEIKLPNSLKTITMDAFKNCTGLTSITLPNSVTTVEDNAFSGCSGLTSVTFSNSLTEIGSYAFEGCTGLTSIDLPFSLTSLAYGMFYDCTGLASVKIPNSVTAIEDDVFAGCKSLKEIILPPSVETIKTSAFDGANALTTIKMGCNIKTIEETAFRGCPASVIYITAQTPPAAQLNSFSFYDGTLYLQGQAAVNAYANADACWDNFKSDVMVEPTKIEVNTKDINGKPGDTFQLTAKILPENVSLPHVFWRSTNPEIATVDNNGLVTLKAGSNNLTPTAENDETQNTDCTIIAESLYANGPIAEIAVNDSSSAIDNIIYDTPANGDVDFSSAFEVYSIQGIKVGTTITNLAPGIYIIRQGRIARKIVIKQ